MGITIYPCPNCVVTVENNRARWTCSSYHPEILAVSQAMNIQKDIVGDEPCTEDNHTEEEIMIMTTAADIADGHREEDVYTGFKTSLSAS